MEFCAVRSLHSNSKISKGPQGKYGCYLSVTLTWASHLSYFNAKRQAKSGERLNADFKSHLFNQFWNRNRSQLLPR